MPKRTPVVTGMQVTPVAGHDSMLLNLSGAHGPFFTRNIVILQDSAGHTGVGEVPGGERIRETLVGAQPLMLGEPIGTHTTWASAPGTTRWRCGISFLAGTSITSVPVWYVELLC